MQQYAGQMEPVRDQKLKELIACLAIHLTIRPPDESVAWTLHMRGHNPFSLFATGCVEQKFIVGHVIVDYILHTDVNKFHSQVSKKEGELIKSAAQCESSQIDRMVEHFYRQSEQLPIRIKFGKDSDRALGLAAMPEYDQEWFEEVRFEILESFEEFEPKAMKSCEFAFQCDCSPEKLLPFIRSIEQEELKDLYQDTDTLLINCPRCGRNFEIKRSDL
jgi:molecular chaperone Hsp33